MIIHYRHRVISFAHSLLFSDYYFFFGRSFFYSTQSTSLYACISSMKICVWNRSHMKLEWLCSTSWILIQMHPATLSLISLIINTQNKLFLSFSIHCTLNFFSFFSSFWTFGSFFIFTSFFFAALVNRRVNWFSTQKSSKLILNLIHTLAGLCWVIIHARRRISLSSVLKRKTSQFSTNRISSFHYWVSLASNYLLITRLLLRIVSNASGKLRGKNWKKKFHLLLFNT